MAVVNTKWLREQLATKKIKHPKTYEYLVRLIAYKETHIEREQLRMEQLINLALEQLKWAKLKGAK